MSLSFQVQAKNRPSQTAPVVFLAAAAIFAAFAGVNSCGNRSSSDSIIKSVTSPQPLSALTLNPKVKELAGSLLTGTRSPPEVL